MCGYITIVTFVITGIQRTHNMLMKSKAMQKLGIKSIEGRMAQCNGDMWSKEYLKCLVCYHTHTRAHTYILDLGEASCTNCVPSDEYGTHGR